MSYLNFKAVLSLPKTARSAQTHKSISIIWIVWSTLWFICISLKPGSVSNPRKFQALNILIFFWVYTINQKKSGGHTVNSGCENPFRLATRKNLMCHPQNHFSGCRLKGCSLPSFLRLIRGFVYSVHTSDKRNI